MLVDIPDVEVIVGIILSFIGGLVAITLYKTVKPRFTADGQNGKILKEKLEYYENLLIDMKIRLDSIEMAREPVEITQEQIQKPKEVKVLSEPVIQVKEDKPKDKTASVQFGNVTDYILRLITEKQMTSRDIQITIGRTREHTSRMLKKLFEDGLVERDMSTKPFSYKITDKGMAKIGITIVNTV